MEEITLYAATFDKAYFLYWPSTNPAPDLYYFYQEHAQPQAFNCAAHSTDRWVRVRFAEDWNEPKAAAFDTSVGAIIVIPKKVDSLLALNNLILNSLTK